MGAAVWLLIGMLCVYTMFLIALSSIASAVLLAIGPLFIVMLLFDATRRFFDAWIAQLANYALITILTVLVAALLLQVVKSYAAQTAARGAALVTVDALDMVLVAVLVFLLLRQVMPIASSLAGGLALSSLSLLSRTLGGGARLGKSAGKWGAKGGIAIGSRYRSRRATAAAAAAAAAATGAAPTAVVTWRDP
jgi:type IV secretion system protein VirB6